MVDTYIDDLWQNQLETDLSPSVDTHIGRKSTVHVFIPNETIGNDLGISPLKPQHYSEVAIEPIVRLILPRKRAADDDEKVNKLIEILKEVLHVKHGKLILEYIDENGVGLDDEKVKEF